MYKGLSISIGLFSAITILFGVGGVVLDKAYVGGSVIALIGVLLAWISVLSWRRSPSSAPQAEAESEEQKRGKKALQAVGAIVLLVLFYFFAIPNLVRKHVTSDMVSESIKSYNLVKGTNNRADTCAYASIVATSMVQAEDVEGYKKWKAIQAVDCEIAGIPRPK
jgi:hypothetical protein